MAELVFPPIRWPSERDDVSIVQASGTLERALLDRSQNDFWMSTSPYVHQNGKEQPSPSLSRRLSGPRSPLR